jgi:hypothetical protein
VSGNEERPDVNVVSVEIADGAGPWPFALCLLHVRLQVDASIPDFRMEQLAQTGGVR